MKNPFANMRPRTIRIIYTIFAIVALIVGTDRLLQVMVFRVTTNDQCAWLSLGKDKHGLLITGVVKGGVTDKAGIADGDTLIKINGIAFTTSAGAQVIIDSLNAGDFATYTVKRGTSIIDANVEMAKIFDVRFLALFLLGFGFCAVGYIVVMTKPQGQIQRIFARYGIFALLLFSLLTPNLVVGRDPQWKILLINYSFIISRVIGQALFIIFFFYFPVRKNVLRHRWIKPLVYACSIASVAAILFVVKDTTATILITISVILTPFIFFGIGLIVFVHSYFRNVEPNRRIQLRPILLGIAVGLSSILFISIMSGIDPFAIFLNPVLVSPILFIIAVPLAFGYSIFRYGLMDLDLIIQRSLIYGAVTATLAAIYVSFVFGIGSVLGVLMGKSDSKILSAVAFVVIAFVFDPVKRRVQESIDKIFYRERRDYQKALLEFSQELPRQMNLQQILSSVVQRISNTMHVEKVAVLVFNPDKECIYVNHNIAAEFCSFTESPDGFIALLRETKTPQSFALLEEEPDTVSINESDRTKIIQSGIVLSIPMVLKDRFIGAMNVGPKLSGKIYSQEDIDLLSTVASQAAIAIENARLHRSEIEKQKIEEELNLARKIQEGLLPKSNPKIAGLDIAGISLPAQTVGGDYFDYIPLGEQQLLVIVADVSGKGMSASLYMSKVQGMVQLAAQMYHTPKDILINVNKRLYDGMERKSFITMVIALFDMEKREVRICRAGHHKVLLRTNETVESLPAKGIGLGLERGPLFESELEERCQPVLPNQFYVFYSDGLTETMNSQNDEFGEERIAQIISHAHNTSAADLQQMIIAAITQFQGAAEQHDDMTLVVVKS